MKIELTEEETEYIRALMLKGLSDYSVLSLKAREHPRVKYNKDMYSNILEKLDKGE